MWCRTPSILISFVVIAVSGSFCLAECPSADLTGACFVDYEDFALMAAQWITTDPCIPDDMVRIPGGTFEMGDSFGEGSGDELPVHTVTLDSFYMGKYEVTNQQYCDYLNSAFGSSIYVSSEIVYGTGNNQPYCATSTADSESQIALSGGVFSVHTKNGRDMSNDPMVQVSWYGAVAYCNWRSQQDGYEQCYNLSTWTCDFNKHGYRLATEAEWEYAARGGLSGMRFPWGDTISHSQANYYSRSSYFYDVSPTRGFHPTWNDGVNPYTSPVDSFPANGCGLYDMAGNVWQWCNDWYGAYGSSPTNNPTGPITGSSRVLRGGAWYYFANYCRVASRNSLNPGDHYDYHGFRLVLLADCPSADLTGDCFVDYEDFALMADQWLTGDMVLIPGGTFQMGDNLGDGWSSELPVHTVTVDSFYMGKYEVTNGQYCDYLNSAKSQGLITITSGVVYQPGSGTSRPYCDTSTSSSYSQIDYSGGVFSVRTKNGRDMSNDPMVQVSWYGAVAYCNWRSRQEGKRECYNLSTWNCDFSKRGYRLATEAEWEYAARGGLAGRRFPWGDTISHSQANYYACPSCYTYDVNPTEGYHPDWDDVYPYTSPRGSFAANGYGLYDMAGNVLEWCNDRWQYDYYSSSSTNNPTGPISGEFRVIRGGRWSYVAYLCRVTSRGSYTPWTRYDYFGFRCVVDF